MQGIQALIASIGPMLSMLFGIEIEQRLGNPVIDMVEAKLKQATVSAGQRAINQGYINRFNALSAAANSLVQITQPSAEQLDQRNKVESELKELESKLVAMV
jgi:hypothetical protein